jgi:hypothetical protein
VRRDLRDPQDPRAPPELKGRRVPLGRRAYRVHRGPPECRDPRELTAHKGFKEPQELKATLAPKGRKDSRA